MLNNLFDALRGTGGDADDAGRLLPHEITSITPSSGPSSGGTPVTIRGTGFSADTGVLFGEMVATDIVVINEQLIAATTSKHEPGPVDVKLITGEGEAATLVEGFTFISDALAIDSIMPTSGSIDGGTPVTIVGGGFTAVTRVLFGTTAAVDFTIVSDGVVTATTPANDAGTVGIAMVDGSAHTVMLADAFNYMAPEELDLTIYAVTPGSGTVEGGTAVTITGAGFSEGVAVLFGDVAASNVNVINYQLLTAVTPRHAAGSVTLTLDDGAGNSASLDDAFTFVESVDPIAIDSVTPAQGSIHGGTEVTINGSGFASLLPNVEVYFGAAAAADAKVMSDTRIVAITPPHAQGAVIVAVSCEIGQTATLDGGFTFLPPEQIPLTIASISPSSGPIEGGTSVTIRGTGFAEGTGVFFDMIAAQDVDLVSDSLMTAVTPAHAEGTVTLLVAVPDGREVVTSFLYAYDTDGDGLADPQEIEGWDIWVDYFGIGLGTDTYGNFPGLYSVVSDPNSADTDGDGLTDYEEFLIGSDPGKTDTDEDGLGDKEERVRWLTSPISVDTDADSRGPGGDLAANAALFDGHELYTRRARQIARLADPQLPGHLPNPS